MRKRLLSIALLVAATTGQAASGVPLDQEYTAAHAERRTQMCAGGLAAFADSLYDDIAHHRLSDRSWHESTRDFAAYTVLATLTLRRVTQKQVEKDLAPLMISRWHSKLLDLARSGPAQAQELQTWLRERCAVLLDAAIEDKLVNQADLADLSQQAEEEAQRRHKAAVAASLAATKEAADRARQEALDAYAKERSR